MSNKVNGKLRPKITVTLDYPFEWAVDGETKMVESIELARPKGKHLKRLGRNVNLSEMLIIASKVSGFTPAFFEEMDGADCMKVTDIINDFLDSGEETGQTS